jgi:MFS family permease
VWLPALACGLMIPIGVVQFATASVYISLACGFATALLMNIFIAPAFALANSLVAPNVRAFTSATLLASTAIVGSGLGPFVTGVLSDYWMNHAIQDSSLRYAISASLPCAGIAAWLFVRAAVHLRPVDIAHPMERVLTEYTDQ